MKAVSLHTSASGSGQHAPALQDGSGPSFSFVLEKKTIVSDSVPAVSTGTPMVTVWQRGNMDYVIGIAIVLPNWGDSQNSSLDCTAFLIPSDPVNPVPSLKVVVEVPSDIGPDNSYGIFYGRYEWTQSDILAVHTSLNTFGSWETMANITGIFNSFANPTPITASYVISGLIYSVGDVLPPSISLDGNRVNIAVMLPDDNSGEPQQPGIDQLPAYIGDNDYNVLPVLVQNVIHFDQATTSTLFVASFEVDAAIDAIHAVIEFADSPVCTPKPGPRGTYVAVLKMEGENLP